MIELEAASTGWPDYRAVWRWHFYAGLFCIPFVVLLSIDESIYLFKNEIEPRRSTALTTISISMDDPATAADQTTSGDCEDVPGSSTSKPTSCRRRRDSAVRVIVKA